MNVLNEFKTTQQWVLAAGDMLYLPPNVAHHGVALDTGMTWSVGSRAPSSADLLQAWGEWLAFAEDEGGRFTDAGLKAVSRAGEIDKNALKDLKNLMVSNIEDSNTVDAFLAAFLSRFRLAHDPVSPPISNHPKETFQGLIDGHKLFRNPWTRLTCIETNSCAQLFAAGQSYPCK